MLSSDQYLTCKAISMVFVQTLNEREVQDYIMHQWMLENIIGWI